MKEIICDTNIWYDLGKGLIQKPKNVKLIATWVNIIELGFSHPEIKEKLNPDDTINAAKAILNYSDEIIEQNAFAYPCAKVEKGVELKSQPSILSILKDIADTGLPSNSTYHTHKYRYDYFIDMKNNFADTYNREKRNIRSKEIYNRASRESFKKSDSAQIEEHVLGLLSDIRDYLNKEQQLEIVFPDDDSFHRTLETIKIQLECFIYTRQTFAKKSILEKNMKIQPNDFFDLLNLIYVGNDKLYWTKEKRWITSIKEAKMEKYLYN
jgi:hypothetical protein